MLRAVEYAPLRPVPLVPAGPVDPDRAAEHVAALIPGVGPDASRALALVVLGGRTRAGAAAELELDGRALARALASARTALRRFARPLPGGGWCRRAELLVSDRIDGTLAGARADGLETHLRNCSRCVEHERRLVLAQNSLVSQFGRAPSAAEPAALTLVEPAADEHEPPRMTTSASLTTAVVAVLLALATLLVIAAIAFAIASVVG
jgi:hypothetical protein